MYWHATPLYNPDNFRMNAENVFGNTVSLNMLCINRGPEAAWRDSRLSCACNQMQGP